MTVFYPHTPKTKSDRLPFLVLVFLILSCIVGATFFFNSNINWNINIGNINRLHPFYLVYVGEGGKIISNHVEVKKTLDSFRALCKEKEKPDFKLAEKFNKETKEGLNMGKYSDLLGKAIESIISVKENQDLNSLFKSGGTTISKEKIKGLEDFELICFLVIK